jgi:predicted NAD/FAD-binding protein
MTWTFGSMTSKFNRRTALNGITTLFGTSLLPFSLLKAQELSNEAPTRRLAIIGGGMGGISTAYFCGSDWNIDLFESEARTGGNADTRSIQVDGKDLSMDVGAEFFHPETHPLYWRLLTLIGAHTPDNKATDLVLEAPASLCIYDRSNGEAFFSSANPLDHLIRAANFYIFSSAARKMVDSDESYEISMGDWLDQLKVTKDFRENVLSPWLASLSCVDVGNVRRQSARSHLSAFAKTFPTNLLKSPKTYNSRIGLGGYLELLKNRCENLHIHLSSPVKGLEEVNGQWFVETPTGRQGPFDAVVVNAPPFISKDFFAAVPWAAELKPLLEAQEYYPTRIILHKDPIYMPKDPKNWSVQNAAVGEGQGEASVWLGEIFSEGAKEKMNLFKSWALKRKEESQEILADRKFLHTLSTPKSIRAIKELRNWQGRNNLYFAGHFTTTTDLQETALFSALEAARKLSPESIKLSEFETILKKDGLDAISYHIP